MNVYNKFRGTHTSLMDDAKKVVNILYKLSIIKGVSPGIIVKKNSVSGSRSIKISYSKSDNLQMVSILVCSKIYTQKINILLYKPIDNAIELIRKSLIKYSAKYNIYLK
jgi:hypothetical protein